MDAYRCLEAAFSCDMDAYRTWVERDFDVFSADAAAGRMSPGPSAVAARLGTSELVSLDEPTRPADEEDSLRRALCDNV